MNKKTKLLVVLNLALISITLIWMIGGNIYTQHQKQAIDQYWVGFFNKNIKIVETNQAALNFQKSINNFGYNFYGRKDIIKDNIMGDITRYLENQLKNENLNTKEDYPQKIHQILTEFSPELKKVRRSLLMNDVPQWDNKIYFNINSKTRLPSLLSFVNFEKILVLDSLDKIRSGEIQIVLDNLELSWRIKESIRQQPTLFAQLVSLIMDSYLIGVIRKLDHVPVEWETRINQLLAQDYYNSFWIGIQLEIFSLYNSLSNFSVADFTTMSNNFGNDQNNELSKNRFAQFINLFHRPYLTFSAIDFSQKKYLIYQKIPNKNFCNFDPDKFKQQYSLPLASWSLIQSYDDQSLINQWLKLFRKLIDWELTLKILQVKELAIKQGKWPDKVPGLKTSICEDRQWIYQVSPDGKTMSISYSKPPSWWQKPKIGTIDYSLSYSSQQIPRLNPKSKS